MKTLGVTTWDKIKVGEVFAEYWYDILYIHLRTRINDREVVVITSDNPAYDYKSISHIVFGTELHKLPLSVQRLWIGA